MIRKNKKKLSKKITKKKTIEAFWWEAALYETANKAAVQTALFKLGTTGIVEESDRLVAYFEPHAYPNSKKLAELLHAETQCRVVINKIPAQDWESEWKKNFKPRKISKKFVVRPSWEKYKKKKHEQVLIIDPKMSFGTGTHETTQLVIRLMESTVKTGVVLDIGTGTGILAIAAAKLGCKKIYAFDVDENSYENAVENIRRNRCSSRIEVLQGRVETLPSSWPKKFDVILANIQKNVILEILGTIRDLMSHKGILFVSGILTSEDESMRQAFADHGLKLTESKQEGEWAAYALMSSEMRRV